MQIKEKLISILMPVKNAGNYLRSCLESIQSQSEANWELVAIDDYSSDHSLSLLQEFAQMDSRIKVFSNSGKGIVDALKTAYKYAKGCFIHRMDADDIMPPQKLNTMLSYWKPGTLVTGKVQYFSDEWLVGLGFKNYESWLNELMDKSLLWPDIYMECPIPSPAWLMHRTDFEGIGGFDSNFIPEDYDLCFRVYKHKIKVITISEVIHFWRDSQGRTSRKDPNYFPMAYYPLKVHYFIEIDRDKQKPLILWGAGKKGKVIATLLNKRKETFTWITDNPRKTGIEMYGQILCSPDEVNMENAQSILAVASPEDKTLINARLNQLKLIKAWHYWWFC